MDRLLLGLSTTGVGMLVVFSGLVILIACIYIMTSITGRKKAAPKAEAAPIPAPAPVREIEEAPEEADAEETVEEAPVEDAEAEAVEAEPELETEEAPDAA